MNYVKGTWNILVINVNLNTVSIVVSSSGKSELIILPLALMISLSRYKLSCLIVVFTSRFTFTLLLVRRA